MGSIVLQYLSRMKLHKDDSNTSRHQRILNIAEKYARGRSLFIASSSIRSTSNQNPWYPNNLQGSPVVLHREISQRDDAPTYPTSKGEAAHDKAQVISDGNDIFTREQSAKTLEERHCAQVSEKDKQAHLFDCFTSCKIASDPLAHNAAISSAEIPDITENQDRHIDGISKVRCCQSSRSSDDTGSGRFAGSDKLQSENRSSIGGQSPTAKFLDTAPCASFPGVVAGRLLLSKGESDLNHEVREVATDVHHDAVMPPLEEGVMTVVEHQDTPVSPKLETPRSTEIKEGPSFTNAAIVSQSPHEDHTFLRLSPVLQETLHLQFNDDTISESYIDTYLNETQFDLHSEARNLLSLD